MKYSKRLHLFSYIADVLPHSPQMEGLPEQKSSDQVESSATGSISSILEIIDESNKLPQVSQLQAPHHHFSRAMLYKNPRYCSRKYYRRNIANHGDASTSHASDTHPIDGSIIFQLANKYSSCDSTLHTEGFDRAFVKPERIRSRLFGTSAVSSSVGKMRCGICEGSLRKKLHSAGGVGASSDLSVVAVLVCGHVFHADCLERNTCKTTQMDPPCPMCPRLTSHVDATGEQKRLQTDFSIRI
ncbi:OLC1v1038046C1 [Oldenlandia corymbosa var. corymbosa]|uniref:OLC1v1038046C1 n=1 Tax=Oldenlandia corymbosa var. corymbosa TaxID=529605 RepID=A0AAV1CZU2_OLDCO|nr:OLC1v1038046C1 [Oldenlandia corymbosa var. corymbosa]